ncbi:GNAT family N-acetyltransferase [Pseudotenacibaculum sp. MALMAid0570]|uniref:GNAT family N-acetyltransferase n=1 Tax=Pseudotenacibaculum sp. MALMAid0570 TaxID=3143938 RepID=UPI0032E0445E
MFSVLKLDTEVGQKQYRLLLKKYSVTDPYLLLDYIEIFDRGFKNLVCFSYENKNSKVFAFMPGYLRLISIGDIETPYFDFISPYGYTGPYFSDEMDINQKLIFWKNINNWYLKNKVVSEFIRFNLFENYTAYNGERKLTMLNIKGNIIGEDSQWKAFDRKVRKNVNKAKRENLSCKVYYQDITKDKIKEFYDIYIDTMKRTNAKEAFFYHFEDFYRFVNENKNNCCICIVYSEDTPISSELVLKSKDTIYSFLGGTNEEFFSKRPNDFLKVELINWARQQGLKFYVLGGGYGMEDGIFKYKKAFFPNDIVNFYTGRKIINENVYNELIRKANKIRLRNGLAEINGNNDSFFPLYRCVF